MTLDEIIEVIGVKPFYQEPAGVIYCADCLDILPRIPDKCIDLVLTDPPYGLDVEYCGYIDTKDNLISLISVFMPEFIRVANRSAISTGISPLFLYPNPDWIIACKWNTTGSFGRAGFNQWFPIVLYGKDLIGFGSINGVLKSDVIDISGGGSVGFMRRGEKKCHPCPKPINIIRHLIKRLSLDNQIILDPFLGSGTTAVAAKQLGRRYIGIEIEERYCEIAVKRLSQEVLSFGQDDGDTLHKRQLNSQSDLLLVPKNKGEGP